MTDIIEVDAASLRAHSIEVSRFMDQLAGATSSASDTWDLRAFGLACVLPAQVLQAWTSSATNYIGDAIGAGHYIAQQLDAMADAYDSSEATSQQAFSAIQSCLTEETG